MQIFMGSPFPWFVRGIFFCWPCPRPRPDPCPVAHSEDRILGMQIKKFFVFFVSFFRCASFFPRSQKCRVPSAECSNFLILHGFLWLGRKNVLENMKMHSAKVTQHHLCVHIEQSLGFAYLPVNCGHNSVPSHVFTNSLGIFLLGRALSAYYDRKSPGTVCSYGKLARTKD